MRPMLTGAIPRVLGMSIAAGEQGELPIAMWASGVQFGGGSVYQSGGVIRDWSGSSTAVDLRPCHPRRGALI